jgi:hypothetical protein
MQETRVNARMSEERAFAARSKPCSGSPDASVRSPGSWLSSAARGSHSPEDSGAAQEPALWREAHAGDARTRDAHSGSSVGSLSPRPRFAALRPPGTRPGTPLWLVRRWLLGVERQG